MKIDLQTIKVADLVAGYEDRGEQGVRGYGGRLDIRPAYQREFVYDEKKRNAVIDTVRRGFPLNTMYWAVDGAGDERGFELLDGQQRTISICQYVTGEFSVPIDGKPFGFANLPAERRQQILGYELSIYQCDGSEGDKLDWFKVINTAGAVLTPQELRNAVYTGPWLADAKRWFSRRGGPAYASGHTLVTGDVIRQEYLETAIDWLAGGLIEPYMAAHQHDQNANPLWAHFNSVITWVNLTFPHYRKEMKGVDWGRLYAKHGHDQLDTAKLEAWVAKLMQDEDVTRKAGIYDYVLTGNERALSIRAFNDKMRREAYERQGGVCPVCHKHFEFDGMEADHTTPWSKGGRTTADNCRMLCKADNRLKSGV